MKTTMDRAGRVVVPKAIRDRLQLADGGEVEITEHDGVAEIRPATLGARVIDAADGPVVDPGESMPPLTDDVVRDTLDSVRR